MEFDLQKADLDKLKKEIRFEELKRRLEGQATEASETALLARWDVIEEALFGAYLHQLREEGFPKAGRDIQNWRQALLEAFVQDFKEWCDYSGLDFHYAAQAVARVPLRELDKT